MFRFINIFLLVFFLCIFTYSYGQTGKNSHSKPDNYLISFKDTVNNQSGYMDEKGDTIIAAGIYDYCYTDTFVCYAIVYKMNTGFIAIDRNKTILYQIFSFDNGPDYPSEGLFRIIRDNKTGYADAFTGKIVIEPQFDCAFPFKNGLARVSNHCRQITDGEHITWTSDEWYYIDKHGKISKKQPKSSF